MRKPILFLTAFIFFSNYLFAQNSMVGDGFGGRGWYKAHNYQVGAYTAYTVCGDSNQLYGWGSNHYGELGNGTTISSGTPIAVTSMNHVKFYTTGYVSTAIKNDSTAWVWGSHNSSSFASGFSNTPTYVLSGVKFADAGLSHAAFIKFDGTVWGVGNNAKGALGNGTISSDPVTAPVQMLGINNAVRVVCLGISFLQSATLILLTDSTVKITGGGGYFQLNNSDVPVILGGLSGIVDIKGGAYGAYALNVAGEVFAFGQETSAYPGVLGVGAAIATRVPPTKILFPSGAAPIVALSANNDGYHCFGLDENHNVYAWGNNKYGQLGSGDTTVKSTPILVATNAIDIFAGENFSYILKSDSTLWASGLSGYSDGGGYGSIWMNLPNIKRNVFTEINPTIAPMNLCAPKVWGVVPIKLSNFTCVANGNNAVLNWQSAEETNAAKYIVQYSNDGSSFKDIATVFATGSNSKYNYINQQVSGTAFYRLKMMDKDGSFTYSEIWVVKFDTEASFTIAPNPANDKVYLFTKNNAGIKSIQIISVDGQLVKVLNAYNSGQGICIYSLAKGTYILKAIYQNNETAYGKFIKL